MTRAESPAGVERLAAEQAALRRVATLVARESSPAEVFEAVTEEAARVLCTEAVGLLRFESDDSATLVAQSDTPWDPPPIGTRLPLDGDNILVAVHRTGRSVRVDDWANSSGSVSAIADTLGVRSCVATPIVVEGRTWGALMAATDRTEPLPPDTESRVREFTELVATAIANAEARSQLSRLADEQRALRRVATLVARRVPPAETLAAVCEEVGRLFGSALAAIARYEEDSPWLVYVAVSDEAASVIPVGPRWPIEEGTASATVYRTGRSTRADDVDWSMSDGPMARVAERVPVRSTVASPIVMEDRLWGAAIAASSKRLPDDAEERLNKFTDLVATAIANAEARQEIERLADEHAALRRVATLVAENAESEELFAAVARELAGLLAVRKGVLDRFEGEGMRIRVLRFERDSAVVVGASGGEASEFPIGFRVPLGGENVSSQVFATGRSCRMTDYGETATGPIGRVARPTGVRTAVAVPIVVDGGLWGTIVAGAYGDDKVPADTESRLERFTELIATAIANAEARNEVTTLAEEQAALRRVATLVAQGVPAHEVFSAVSDEVAGLFGTTMAAVGRFDPDAPAIVIVGAAKKTRTRVEIGSRLDLDDALIATQVYRTGRSAWAGPPTRRPASPAVASFLSHIHRVSSVASPIVVDGRLWGVITVTSETDLLPLDTQVRLENFTELVATAIANAETRGELTASRARIVAASDDARRRIERDLHDGAQQRLVSLGLELRMAAENLPNDLPELDARLAHVADEIDDVIDGLREMSRGIHPAILSDGGLGPAIEMLALRAPVPVALDLGVPARCAAHVEVAAYYVVSEALTNTAKHANASRAHVVVEHRDGHVYVSIDDDGDGGARLEGSSGLTGLRDRVEALGGSFALSSPPGDGTVIRVELPLPSGDDPLGV